MNINILQRTMLFKGMTEPEIRSALSALHAEEREYKKGTTILHAGATTERVGLVLQGSVTIENNDIWGNRTILSHIEQGQFFAETYAFLGNEPLLVDVISNENCHILFLRIGSIQKAGKDMTVWTMKLITNLLLISSYKNLLLSGRSFHTSPKTIRGRVMAYLTSVSLQKHSREFDIPFDRQQLADYLNLERSALSKELGKMQKEGILTTRKNHFTIHDD